MSNKHADKEGRKGVYTQQSNLGGKDTWKDQVGGQKKSNSQPHDDTQSDSLAYQQGEKSKNITPNRQKGEDSKKRAGGNPQPAQPTTTNTESIGSSPKPTAAKPQETPTDTQTTVTSPQPTAAKSQQTTTDTQTTVVSPQPTAANSQQTATDTQTTVVSPQPTAAKSQQTATDTQTTVVSSQPTAAKYQPTTGDTQPIGTSPQLTAVDTQTTGVNPKLISDNLQQAGDNPQHKDLSEGADGEVDQQVEEPVYKDSRSTKGQTYNNKRAFPEANPTYIRNRQPRTPEKTKAGQPVRNDKKQRTYGIPKQTGSRSEYSEDEQYDMTEANRIEKSRSRADMDDWTNQLWILIINAIFTVILCALFTIVYSRWAHVPPLFHIDNSNVQKQLLAMERDNRALRNEMKTCQTMLEYIPSKLMTLDKANRRVDNLNEKFGELVKIVTTMTESNTEMLEEIRRKIDNNSDKLSENRERIEEVNFDISNTRIDLEEMLRLQDNNVKKTIQESNKEVWKMNDKIKKTEEEMRSTSEIIKKAEEVKTVLQNEVNNVDEIVAILKANAFNKSVMLNLVVFLTIAVFALIIGMLIICCRVSFDHHGNTPRHGSGTNPKLSVIERVPNNPPLTNTICVISYGQTNESFNRTLVDGLMRQLSQPLQDTPVRRHLINSHDDIANIPHCKLIFMCVESTRHVIIEEPGVGQGDIRRTTYDAVRKLGDMDRLVLIPRPS